MAFAGNECFPVLGQAPIKGITARELLSLPERIQGRGAIDIAHRVRGICDEVFRYGILVPTDVRETPVGDLQGALTSKRNKHMATITGPKAVGSLLRAIDGYAGDFATKCALQLTPYICNAVSW